MKSKTGKYQSVRASVVLSDQKATKGDVFSYSMDSKQAYTPDHMFTYSAILVDGSLLSSWLGFDRETLTFRGGTGILSIC